MMDNLYEAFNFVKELVTNYSKEDLIDLAHVHLLILYPLFVLANNKFAVSILPKEQFNSEKQRWKMLQKVLVWAIIFVMYVFINSLAYNVAFKEFHRYTFVVSLAYFAIFVPIVYTEFYSAVDNYKRYRQVKSVPILKRKAFWLTVIASLIKLSGVLRENKITDAKFIFTTVDGLITFIIAVALVYMLFHGYKIDYISTIDKLLDKLKLPNLTKEDTDMIVNKTRELVNLYEKSPYKDTKKLQEYQNNINVSIQEVKDVKNLIKK